MVWMMAFFLDIEPSETDIDAFPTVIDYRCYRLTTRASYNDLNAKMSIHKLKRNVERLYPTLDPFSAKDPWNF